MLTLHFRGWFQCRLPTGPSDPGDEPRGVSGWTFAMPGEPDLDRVIRFQDPVAPRSPGPTIGVHVVGVSGEGSEAARGLIGAKVRLLENPTFVGRNGVFFEAEDEPVDPFHLEIEGDGVGFRRRAVTSPDGRRAEDVFGEGVGPGAGFRNPRRDLPGLQRRRPVASEAFSPQVADATGVFDYAAHRKQRADAVREALSATNDPIRVAGLQTRLRELEMKGRRVGLREIALGLRLVYRFALDGPVHAHGTLATRISTNPHIAWPLDLWLGGYDADALAGFADGVLQIPFRPRG